MAWTTIDHTSGVFSCFTNYGQAMVIGVDVLLVKQVSVCVCCRKALNSDVNRGMATTNDCSATKVYVKDAV